MTMKLNLLIMIVFFPSFFAGTNLAFSAQNNIPVADPLTYTRLFADSTGASHFEDLELAFTLIDFAPPAPPISVSEVFSSENVFVISSPSGWHGDWHPTPEKQFIFVLTGVLEVEVSDGEIRQFKSGSVILVEDTYGTGHISRVTSEDRCYVVVVPIGSK